MYTRTHRLGGPNLKVLFTVKRHINIWVVVEMQALQVSGALTEIASCSQQIEKSTCHTNTPTHNCTTGQCGTHPHVNPAMLVPKAPEPLHVKILPVSCDL